MNSSLIVRAAAQFLLPLLLMFSLFLLLRGHHLPGGGFIGGLVASAALALQLFASDVATVRQLLRIDPRTLIGAGLLVALAASLAAPLAAGRPFFAALWGSFWLPLLGKVKLGTPLLFDFGVYLVVIGVVLSIVLQLAQPEEHGE